MECPRCAKLAGRAETPLPSAPAAASASAPPPRPTVALIQCPACAKDVSSQAAACPHCGQPINDSGTGNAARLPDELKGLNWGACLLGPLWSIFHSTWWGMLAIIPGWGLIMCVILLIKGNEWAWQNRRWDSVEQFKAVQRQWLVYGRVLVIVGVVGAIVGYCIDLVFPMYGSH